MTAPTPAAEFVVYWLGRAAELLDDAVGRLTDLDAARGDADHGVNMQRGFAAVATASTGADAETVTGPDDALLRASTAIRRTIGGTSGPLWSVALRRMGKAIGPAETIGLADLASMIDAAVTGVRELGGAELGEGTMIDSLDPAAAALHSAAERDLDFEVGVRAAIVAADRAAQDTARHAATKGRAAYLGERGVGSPDPGAVSAAIVVAALVD